MVALQERNFSARDANMYKGHKVVAMPSGNALSVRDMVSSRSAFDPNRPRSLSAGRATTMSRDIVQEVYDRMGVPRSSEPFDEAPQNLSIEKDSRGRFSAPQRRRDHSPDSAEKFSQRYRAAAELSSPRVGDRGRCAEQGEARRSRSLSRGRAVAGRWPPVQTSNEQSAPQPVAFKPRKSEEPVSTVPSSPNRKKFSRSESEEEYGESDSASKDSEEKSGSVSIPSVKDRISAYAGVRNSARNFPQKKPANYQTYATRERPAPIDIYEDARKKEDAPKQAEDDVAVSSEPSAVHPSPAAAAAADAAFALVRGGRTGKNVKSAGTAVRTPKARTGIAGAYLGAIKSPTSTAAVTKPTVTQPTSAPLTEISAVDPNGDGHSVAASSVSADEFNFTPTGRSVGGTSTKKPTWAERNRSSQVSPNVRTPNGQYSTNGSKPSTPSASEIEKIIEQRVQARVSVVEMRMEEQMQRLERRMEEKLKSRIDVLDDKLDKMNSMLAMLLSRELSGSPNEHRENEI